MSRETTGFGPVEGGDLLDSPLAARVGLASELAGELRCARCAYDLRGLSIRSVCPECATPVRATLLLVVDPLADELRAIYVPRLAAWGLVAWSVGALAAVIGTAAMRSEVFLGAWMPREVMAWLAWGVVASVIVSGVGAASSLLWPHGGIRRGMALAAAAGVGLHVPLVLVVSRAVGARGHEPWTVLLAMVLVAMIIVMLRPVARLLQARSFLMRSGQVDRQTLRVLAVVVLIAAVGELVQAVALWQDRAWSDLALPIGAMVTAAAWTLFGVGIAGVVVDCWRIRGVILQPPLSLAKLLGNDVRSDA